MPFPALFIFLCSAIASEQSIYFTSLFFIANCIALGTEQALNNDLLDEWMDGWMKNQSQEAFYWRIYVETKIKEK